jgi:hypothetical protein
MCARNKLLTLCLLPSYDIRLLIELLLTDGCGCRYFYQFPSTPTILTCMTCWTPVTSDLSHTTPPLSPRLRSCLSLCSHIWHDAEPPPLLPDS